jgi:hypothetical protein
MNKPIAHLSIILMVLMLSCTNRNKETKTQTNVQDTIVQSDDLNLVIEKSIDNNLIIEQLQGKWKEIEYPFRSAEFVNSTVKFIEEGTAGNPDFEAYEISEKCSFENNNIRDLISGDIILNLPENSRCEKLKVENDTLTLSGFSSNTNENYSIRYQRMK